MAIVFGIWLWPEAYLRFIRVSDPSSQREGTITSIWEQSNEIRCLSWSRLEFFWVNICQYKLLRGLIEL